MMKPAMRASMPVSASTVAAPPSTSIADTMMFVMKQK
jgi:hypothetical protein